ncbi:MAG: hypothetical protein KUG80_02740 [Gammaproteobacteria bacterium]|nr:hypothetical protein [Gammaproteobacteria bacterium]
MKKNKSAEVSNHGFFYKLSFRLIILVGLCVTAFFIINATNVDNINSARESLNEVSFWINTLKAILLCVFALFWNGIAQHLSKHFEVFKFNLEYILSARWVVVGWALAIFLLLDLRVVNYLL